MSNTAIKKLKEISRQIYNCSNSLEVSLAIIEKGNNYNNEKITKENFEDFLNRIKYSNNKLNYQDFLFMSVSKIKDIFGNIIKENFPFYTDYNISLSMSHDFITVIISVSYYYMGKKEHYDDIVPLNNEYLEKNIRCLESSLMDIKKDMISYPDNEIQQKFLREC